MAPIEALRSALRLGRFISISELDRLGILWYTRVMQVFVPSTSMVKSLEILDKRRLAKQRVEAKQLIDTILDRPMSNGKSRKGWRNHPAAVMFRQHLPVLIFYYNASLVVHAERGGNNIKLQPEPELDNLESLEMPWWWGNEEIHASHRGRLKFKGKLDVLADRIKRFTSERGANNWLARRGLPTLNECRQPEWERATTVLDRLGAAPSPLTNYYDQFGWTEDDTLEYTWPGETESDGTRVIR